MKVTSLCLLTLALVACDREKRWTDAYVVTKEKGGTTLYHAITCSTFGQKGALPCRVCDPTGFKEMEKQLDSGKVSDRWLDSDSFVWFHTTEACRERVIAIPTGAKPCPKCKLR